MARSRFCGRGYDLGRLPVWTRAGTGGYQAGRKLGLQASGRTQGGSRSRARASRLFVIAQVSISLLLVAGASLLVRSFWNLQHQDFGYRQEGVLMVEMRIDFATLRAAREIAMQPVYERMNAIPGVRSAALAGLGPFSPVMSGASIALPERPPLGGNDAHPVGYLLVFSKLWESPSLPDVPLQRMIARKPPRSR